KWPLATRGRDTAVVDHVVDRHRYRRVFALDNHAQRITDQDDVGSGAVLQRRETGVVGGRAGAFFAVGLHARQIGHGHRLRTALLQMGIGTGIHDVDYSILVTRSGPCTPDPNRWRPATHHTRLERRSEE